MQKYKKGFTLIELLITIAIIGILTAIISIGASEIMKRSRDTKRTSNLESLAQALILYSKTNNSIVFFDSTTPKFDFQSIDTASGWSEIFSQNISPYLSPLPIDPINDSFYHYTYTAFQDSYLDYKCFKLSTALERDDMKNDDGCDDNAYEIFSSPICKKVFCP